jgi:signal transduction histidine kinase
MLAEPILWRPSEVPAIAWRVTVFSGLRLRLTLIYLTAGLLLIGVIAMGTLGLARSYFQNITDLALQHRMSMEFRVLGEPLPPELALADQTWYLTDGIPVVDSFRSSLASLNSEDDSQSDESDDLRERAREAQAFEGELASIYVLALNSDGIPVGSTSLAFPSIEPNLNAVERSDIVGRDFRTDTLADGTRVRLLTYPLTSQAELASLQLGRRLSDQDRVQNQLLLILLSLGGTGVVLFGLGSWWFAGRTMRTAEIAWEKQQTFIANASHELRTPLTLIRASAEVAQRNSNKQATQNRLLDDIIQESDYMSRLVEDLLLLSRLDAGQLEIEELPIVLTELFDDLERQIGRVAEERKIELNIELVAEIIHGDPIRLRQVLIILLDNALQHSPEKGCITVTVWEQSGKVHISIEDQGEGMEPEIVSKVFDRFYRAEGQKSTGFGLGLSIAKALTEAQNGTISLESAVGKGTTAKLSFPRSL